LLNERGPTTFDVRAADEAPSFRARVTLGVEHVCSACHSSWCSQPCRHTHWVLHMIFGLPRESPIASQAGVSERELRALLNDRAQSGRAARAMPRAAAGAQPNLEDWLLSLSPQDAHLLISGPARLRPALARARAPLARRPLESDECCPICMEEMTDDAAAAARAGDELVWCKVSCGRSMHARCLAAWATHNIGPGLCVNCPLCRAAWPVGAAAARAERAEREAASNHERMDELLRGLAAAGARAGDESGDGRGDAQGVTLSSSALRWFERSSARDDRARETAPRGSGSSLPPILSHEHSRERAARASGRSASLPAGRGPAAAAVLYRPLVLNGGARLRAVESAASSAGAALDGRSSALLVRSSPIARLHRAPGFARS
jgi:hypothetical protein